MRASCLSLVTAVPMSGALSPALFDYADFLSFQAGVAAY